MSNLAALAQAGNANAPQFNAIFYATVATIIPVLFVAAALQADMYAKLIETSQAARRRGIASDVPREVLEAFIIYVVTSWIPGLILIYGVVGEIWVLVDLYLQRTIGLGGPFNGAVGPLIAAASLTVAVGFGPAAKFGTLLYEVHGSSQSSESAKNPPREEPHGDGTAASEPPPPEGGGSSSDQALKSGQS